MILLHKAKDPLWGYGGKPAVAILAFRLPRLSTKRWRRIVGLVELLILN
jgi:hypothetical protein